MPASFLFGAALKSVLILAVALLASILMRRASAASRHLVWLAAAAALLALPALSLWTPALNIPAPSSLRAGIATFQVNAIGRSNDSAAAAGSAASGARAPRRAAVNWTGALGAVWAIGTFFALLRMLLGYAALWRIRRSSRRLPDADIELLESGSGSMPMTAGIFKPAIFLPRDAAEWPAERRRAVLLHELAHVRRADAAAQMIARLALCLYWWNPLEWIAWREFVKERERAADDLVLSSGVGASEYAAHLLEIARSMTSNAHLAGAVAMARHSQLEGRLMAILDSNRSRRAAGRKAMWITAMLAVAAIAPLAAVRAQDNPAIPADVEATIRSAQSERKPEMLESVARAALDRQQFDLARKMLDAALQIRGEISGTSSPYYGVGVMRLANLEIRQHGLLASEALYSQAAGLLAGQDLGAEALIKLGEIAMAKKNLDEAAGYFERAQSSDPVTAGMATMWLAGVRTRQGNFADADRLYKSAIELEPANSLQAAIVMRTFANFLKKQDRGDEAANYLAQSDAIYKTQSVHADHSKANDIGGVAFRTGSGSGSGVDAASANAAAGGPYKIGGDVTPPRVLAKIEPEYSEEARLGALQGTVTLSVVIGVDGMAHDIQVTRSLGLELDDKAVAAVSQWKFAPGTKGGEPVPVIATIEVNFRLL